MKTIETAIKIILTILFISCLFNWQYGYYMLVRFLGMVGFAILSYKEYRKNETWFITWLASSLLINPFVKTPLGRTIWNIVDVVWVILLILSIYDSKIPKKKL